MDTEALLAWAERQEADPVAQLLAWHLVPVKRRALNHLTAAALARPELWATLSAREQWVLLQRAAGASLDDCRAPYAETFGIGPIGRERIRQVEGKALLKLARAFGVAGR